jgi:hypothetical protein
VRGKGVGVKRLEIEVLQETKVCIGLFDTVPGGPLWFHYDCRCKAEAHLIARQVAEEMKEIFAGVKDEGVQEGKREMMYCRRCRRCGRFT